MSSRRFTRLTNAFSKKLENHAAAVSLYVTHYNMCRVHEALRTTPAVALGITERVWSIGDLLDAALAVAPADPTTTAPERRRNFRVEGSNRNLTVTRVAIHHIHSIPAAIRRCRQPRARKRARGILFYGAAG